MAARAILRVAIAICVIVGSASCSSDDASSSSERDSTDASARSPGEPGQAASAAPFQRTDPATVGGVELEPQCEPPPEDEDVEAFFVTLVTGGGGERVLPGDPAFPADYCPENALFATVPRAGRAGPATGGSGTIGDWEWRGLGWCALPGSILWSVHEIEAELGTISVLEESQVVFPDGCGPGTPCAEPLSFNGLFSVLGGTGRYEQARGVWRLVSQQRGDGTTAGVLCGWLG
jgi:hypothetical protein